MSYGIAVMKCAPLHLMHTRILNAMIATTDRCVLLLAPNEVFPIGLRTDMIRTVYGNRIRCAPIDDIGAQTTDEWSNHVIQRAVDVASGEYPTDYFAGRRNDGIWMHYHFYNETFKDLPLDTFCNSAGVHRKLHLIDAPELRHINATAIRTYLRFRDDMWKSMVPPVLIDMILTGYVEWERRVK